MEELRKTWDLLKRVSVAAPGNEHFELARESIEDRRFNVDLLIGLAARHGLVGVLADFLIDSGTSAFVPHRTRKHLVESLSFGRHKTADYLREAASIARAAEAQGLGIAFTKGIVCQQVFYSGRGSREFADMDVMISPTDAGAFTALMESLGYTNRKRYRARTGAWEDFSASDRAMYLLHPDHLPPFFKVNGDSRLPRSHSLDAAFSLTWHDSPWEVPLDKALGSIRTVFCQTENVEAGLPALAIEYDYLFHVLHLFREGWFERSIIEKDVRLGQFTDLWRGWHLLDMPARASLAALVKKNKIEAPVAWVCHHLDRVFGLDMVGALGLGQHCTHEWIGSGARPGGYFQWDGNMDGRLLSLDFDRIPTLDAPTPELRPRRA
ncbi:nucleotidyltransferase family protein [Glycomyces sp. NPDC048151]|uniref:nucleotidyltransferase family protein n=1 Tax=Glycomyces sp. NPDC048151 TaxID=3364002 RepID=UPI00371B3314